MLAIFRLGSLPALTNGLDSQIDIYGDTVYIACEIYMRQQKGWKDRSVKKLHFIIANLDVA